MQRSIIKNTFHDIPELNIFINQISINLNLISQNNGAKSWRTTLHGSKNKKHQRLMNPYDQVAHVLLMTYLAWTEPLENWLLIKDEHNHIKSQTHRNRLKIIFHFPFHTTIKFHCPSQKMLNIYTRVPYWTICRKKSAVINSWDTYLLNVRDLDHC